MARHTIFGACLVLAIGCSLPAQAQPVSDWPFTDWWDPAAGRREVWRPERMTSEQKQRMLRHWSYMTGGVPDPYRGMLNPAQATPEMIVAGGAVYAQNCANCHGATGFGDGDLGRSLEPSPALLSFMIRMPTAVDEYLFWTVSEGGAAFESKMPAYKGRLTDEQIWQVIAFMRAGFPQDAR
jgi:mono/diheme cytochrome c family protein